MIILYNLDAEPKYYYVNINFQAGVPSLFFCLESNGTAMRELVYFIEGEPCDVEMVRCEVNV